MTHTITQLRKLNAERGSTPCIPDVYCAYFAAMPDAMKLLERYHEALVSVVAEAKEHWPDAENWPIIEEITALLEEG